MLNTQRIILLILILTLEHKVQAYESKDTAQKDTHYKLFSTSHPQTLRGYNQNTNESTDPSNDKFDWNSLIGVGTCVLGAFSIIQYILSRDSSQKQLRAYVAVTPSDTVPDGYLTQLHIINEGQTPAYKLTYWAYSCISGIPLRGNLQNKEPDEGERQYSSPHKGIPININIELPDEYPQYAEDIKNKRMGVYIWGKVLYRDIFDDQHTTEFKYVMTGMSIGGNVENVEIRIYEDGNDAD